MQTRQGNMLQSLQSVQAFLEENADALSGVVKTGARQKLAEAIQLLASHRTDQTSSNLASQGATKKQLTLRHALLRDHMQAIARIASADLPPTPEIEPLRMPKGKPTAQRLAAAAYGMAKAAEPFAAQFVAAGLPADFIAQLTAATDAMIASGEERLQSRGRRSGATVDLSAKLTAGRKIVHVLDAFVKSALRDEPGLLANWNVVRRVRRVSTRAADGTPTPAPAPLPTPAPTPASVTP
jgi:hypothetical protein